MTHICGSTITVVARQVVTLPSDRGWPKDAILQVPYCPRCRLLIHITELTQE